LNELEQVRQQMRPTVASRGFPYALGERRPEEKTRPWQFSRYDREFLGRSQAALMQLPKEGKLLVLPESLGFTDSNKLYGGVFRMAAGFWITKVLPGHLAVEYREYNQNTAVSAAGRISRNITELSHIAAGRLRRADLALGLGPLALGERLRISGEIIGRRYWRRLDHSVSRREQENIFGNLITSTRTRNFTETEDRNRLFGSLSLAASLGSRTEAALTYRRLDLFDQDPHIFPRFYQNVMNLEKARITAINQVDLSLSHQFRPGLEWRGSVGGGFFSDNNRRFTLYQGLAWQAVRQPGMQLELTPHFFLASYRERRQAYFSPGEYLAPGLALSFHRQFYRLPTLILQGAAQGVGQHGAWGPALQGLAALEWEPVQNFYIDPYIFYFREWVDNYRLLTVGISFRYRF
jgi:hypothetical protein